MSLHIECSTVPRDHFGKLLSPLEQADALLFSQTIAAGEISKPLPVGVGLLLTLTSSVDMWVAIGRTQPHRSYDFRPPPAAKAKRQIKELWRIAMTAKLETDDAKALYKKCKQTVEPMFGIIKSAMGFVRFRLRVIFNVAT